MGFRLGRALRGSVCMDECEYIMPDTHPSLILLLDFLSLFPCRMADSKSTPPALAARAGAATRRRRLVLILNFVVLYSHG